MKIIDTSDFKSIFIDDAFLEIGYFVGDCLKIKLEFCHIVDGIVKTLETERLNHRLLVAEIEAFLIVFHEKDIEKNREFLLSKIDLLEEKGLFAFNGNYYRKKINDFVPRKKRVKK